MYSEEKDTLDLKISLVVSLMIHALIISLLYLLRNIYFTPVTFEVQIVKPSEEKRIIVEEDPLEISEEVVTKNLSTEKRKNIKTGKTSSQVKKSKQSPGKPVTVKKTFADDFERSLFTKKNSEKTAFIPGSTKSNWDDDKRKSTPGKKEAGENIKIPAGKTTSGNTKWKKGGSRKLLKRPSIEYPPVYRKQAMQGRVSLQIEVDSQGKVVDVDVVRSSGYPRLDLNARNAYRNALFNAAPGARENSVGIIDVYFKLKDN